MKDSSEFSRFHFGIKILLDTMKNTFINLEQQATLSLLLGKKVKIRITCRTFPTQCMPGSQQHNLVFGRPKESVFFFSVLGLELRAFTLSHSNSSFL
jgi:hypothetical protein